MAQIIVSLRDADVGLPLVDTLARLALEVKRLGGTMTICDAPDDLDELLDLVGLSELRR